MPPHQNAENFVFDTDDESTFALNKTGNHTVQLTETGSSINFTIKE
jgi:hypothetical protein